MTISSFDPKQEIINLTEPLKPLTREMQGRVILPKDEVLIEKMKRVRQLLHDNPHFYQDSTVVVRVLEITKGRAHRTIKELRREFVVPFCSKETKGIFLITNLMYVWPLVSESERSSVIRECGQKGGFLSHDTLTISENQLAKFSSEKKFWDLVKEFKVKKLVFLTANGSKSYEGMILEQLAKKNVPLLDLVKEITVEFAEGEQLQETKAKLRLCGSFFEALIESGMRETRSARITLKEISLQSFWKVLTGLESGKLEDLDEADPEIGFLQFKPPLPPAPPPLPAGLLGQEEWSKWGDGGLVPHPPQWLLDTYNKDFHVAFYMPPKIDGQWLTIKSIREIAKTRHHIDYEYIWDRIMAEIGDQHGPDEGYWCLRPKFLPDPTRAKSFDPQMGWLTANYPGYRAPLALEVIVSELLYYVASGKKECLLGRSPWSYTRCQEVVGGYRVIVGGLAPSGLDVIHSRTDDALDRVGVLPLRK